MHMSVRPSVRHKSAFVPKPGITQTTPRDSPRTLVFIYEAKDIYKIPMGSPPMGRQMQVGIFVQKYKTMHVAE